MPTYLYKCSACGESVEYFQSMSEGPKRKCPACGKLKLVRQIGTGAGVIFKGSGFYETDYRSSSYKKGAEKDKAPLDKSSSSGDSSSTSKSDSAKSADTKKKASGE